MGITWYKDWLFWFIVSLALLLAIMINHAGKPEVQRFRFVKSCTEHRPLVECEADWKTFSEKYVK